MKKPTDQKEKCRVEKIKHPEFKTEAWVFMKKLTPDQERRLKAAAKIIVLNSIEAHKVGLDLQYMSQYYYFAGMVMAIEHLGFHAPLDIHDRMSHNLRWWTDGAPKKDPADKGYCPW